MSRNKRRRHRPRPFGNDRPSAPVQPSSASDPEQAAPPAGAGDVPTGPPRGLPSKQPVSSEETVEETATTRPVARDLPRATGPALWRPEEARVVDEAPAAIVQRPESLWRPEETGRSTAVEMVPRAPAPAESGPALWRPEEGTPITAVGTTGGGPDRAKSANGRPAPEGSEEDGATPASPARRITRVAVALLVLVLVAFVGDLGFAGYLANRALHEARGDLERGADAFRDGQTGAAHDNFQRGVDDSHVAQNATDQPAWAILRGVPPLNRDAKSVRALADASELVSKAGLAAADAGDVLGIDSEGLAGSIYRDGRVQFDVLREGSPFISTAASLIARAFDVLDATPRASLGFIQSQVDSALQRIEEAKTSSSRAQTLVAALPSLLGDDSPKTYLLAFQALGESRGSGGVAGVYGILNTEDGRLRLVDVRPFTDTFPHEFEDVDAPGWFADNYGRQSALSQWQQANVSPNFPAVAQVYLNMYEAQTGDALDGVIALDPVAMSDLMEGTGDIEVGSLDEPITSDNVAKVLMHDSYLEFPHGRVQTNFIEKVVERFWHKISSGKIDGPDLVSGLAEAAQTQHLKIYARDDSDQEAMTQLGVDGSYEGFGPNVQLVFGNNYAANKVDYYMHRSIDTTVQLDKSGSAHVRTKVTLENDAPAGPESHLLGPEIEGIPAGFNRNLLSVLFPKGARAISLKANGEKGTPFEYQDDGYPVAWNVLDMPAGASATLTLDYVMPAAATVSGSSGSFRFSLFPQTTYRPDKYRLTIAPPAGDTSTSSDDGASMIDGYVRYSGELERPQTFHVEFHTP